MGDELKLREVLQNLITNALEHAAREGQRAGARARCSTAPTAPVVKMVVQDDGPGMPEEQLHLVFDRYRHGPGRHGLGLAICKEFVELHGGEIWAERPADRRLRLRLHPAPGPGGPRRPSPSSSRWRTASSPGC